MFTERDKRELALIKALREQDEYGAALLCGERDVGALAHARTESQDRYREGLAKRERELKGP